LAGHQAIKDTVTHPDIHIVLTAMVGFAGLEPTINAIKAGKDIALANKETLVVAGRNDYRPSQTT
jgi:1-deoxy-D-xylulose-5-phosphate reductoisomerase